MFGKGGSKRAQQDHLNPTGFMLLSSVDSRASITTEVFNTLSRALQPYQIDELDVVINCRDESTLRNRLCVGWHIGAPEQ
jgi:hypothetical protein